MSSSSYANLPLGQPPPGIISNFDHAPSRAIEAHIGMGICIGITLVFVLLRFYVKLAITQKWGWDDCEPFNNIFFIEAYNNRHLLARICGSFIHNHLNRSDKIEHRD